MKRVVPIIALFLIFIPCHGHAFEWSPEWTRTELAMQITSTALMCADWNQTRQIATDPRYYETNEILGRDPTKGQVDAYFASYIISNWIIAGLLPHKARKVFQGYFIFVEARAVRHNYRLGIKFNF